MHLLVNSTKVLSVAKSKEGVLPDFVDGIDRVLKDVQPPSLEIHDGGWILAGGLSHDALIWRPLALGVVGVDHTGRGDPDEFQFGVQNGGRIDCARFHPSEESLDFGFHWSSFHDSILN